MQPTSPATAASPIQVPKVDIDEPVAVIPIASGLGEMRSRVGGRPFTYLAAAFSLGYVVARMMR